MKTLIVQSMLATLQSQATAGGAYWPTLVQSMPSSAKRNDIHFSSIEGSTEVHEGCSIS